MTEDCVVRMFGFKERHPTVLFELSPNLFAASVPGRLERVEAMSLCGLMDRLERWESRPIATP
jgi:hypothetical protein